MPRTCDAAGLPSMNAAVACAVPSTTTTIAAVAGCGSVYTVGAAPGVPSTCVRCSTNSGTGVW
jgi:hypothetical protein